ncbi:MAG: hypothetical protein R3D56_17540 [Paracoccaceae bacterium]
MKLKRSLGLAIALGAAIATTSATAWDNPADRYANANKQYTGAACPLAADKIEHFVYFSRDRDAIRDHAFLTSDRFVGAQIMYAWRQLEPTEGHYDFSLIQSDVDYLAKHGKRLFIQLQDASFSPEYKPVPDYLVTGEYDGASPRNMPTTEPSKAGSPSAGTPRFNSVSRHCFPRSASSSTA